MDLISLISGASSNLLDKVGDVSSAIDGAYKSSPLGKLEDSFTNSAIHKAFEGGKFGGGGGGGMTHATVEDVESGYQDATSGLQNVMSQANILNPMAGLVKGGSYSDVIMPDYNRYSPMPIQVAEAPSQQVDPALAEADAIEAEANEMSKKNQGVLLDNPNMKPVPILAR
jgi:hypothetical protein